MKHIKLILALAISAMMLSGCSSWLQPEPLPKPMPVSEMEPCLPELPYPESGDAETVTYSYMAVAEMYHECRLEKDGLAEYIRQSNK